MTIVVPDYVLTEAGAAMEAAGVAGAEATGMLVAVGGAVTRVVFPAQIAGQFPNSWVEVTDHGKAQLAAELATDETYVSRIHSHPGLAFHSPTDDRNPALQFEGALSIVVPFFGLGLRNGLDAAAVFVRRNRTWVCLPPGAQRTEVIRIA